MILGASVMLMIMGVVFMILDMFFPPGLIPYAFLFTFKFMGIGFFAIGLMILAARIQQTGVGSFIDIPNTKRVILMHQRRGKNPNTYFMTAKLDDLEFIRTRNKVFKDTGGGFRIAGHDVRRTHETICHDIPEWLSQYFYQIKDKYNIVDNGQFKELRTALKDIKPPIEGVIGLEDQLKKIALLKPIMEIPSKKQVLLNMNYKQLQNMDEMLFDGTTHHGEEVENFIESATPNELDALEKQKFLNDMMEKQHYKEVGEHNIGQWIGPILFLMVGGAIAAAIIAGAFG